MQLTQSTILNKKYIYLAGVGDLVQLLVKETTLITVISHCSLF